MDHAYVWIWLPGATLPVVAGRISADADQYRFTYGKSYLNRADALPIYVPELPLRAGVLPLLPGLTMPGCLRDAAPDAWGRRVILNRIGATLQDSASELTFWLESGSDRIGALDFQRSATDYLPRHAGSASLEELLTAADRVEQGLPLRADLDRALMHGTSVGGARPKAMITAADRRYIAKFSTSQDLYNVVKAEYVAMRLAALAGLNVAPVRLVRALDRDVLLIERFDRLPTENGWSRRLMVSALTLLGLDEMMAKYASYQDLADIIRHRFTQPRATLAELFSRIIFNILISNTDDHARNHAAFWDGQRLTLTSAYDLCPQARTGRTAGQAMLIQGEDRSSRIATCLAAAPIFQLSAEEALAIVGQQIQLIRSRWDSVCDEAGVSPVDRQLWLHRQFLNPYALEGTTWADRIS